MPEIDPISIQAELASLRAELEAEREKVSRLQSDYDQLAKNEDRFRMMFENIPMGYMSMDENARLMDVNRAFADFFGYTYQEIIGKRFADLLDDHIDYHLNVSFPEFKRTGFAKDLVWNVKKKDGTKASILFNGRVRYDQNGKFIQTHCMMLDITEYRKAQLALSKLEKEKTLVLSGITERIMLHDLTGAVRLSNQDAERLQPGKYCWQVLCHRSTPCEGCPLEETLRTHQACSKEIRAYGRIMHISIHPVHDDAGQVLGLVQIASDVTERRQLEQALTDAGGRERERIGQDLHDGLGQQLTGIAYLAAALKQEVQPEDSSTRESLDRIADTASQAIRSMRSILHGLCPVSKDPLGLFFALENLAKDITALGQVQCLLTQTKAPVLENYPLSTNLFYIAQEAVHNALKHARCSIIKITLSKKHEMLRLEIQDNGQGIKAAVLNAPEASSLKGFGLKSMHYRAGLIGANLEIAPLSGEEKGTLVSCSVPLETAGSLEKE